MYLIHLYSYLITLFQLKQLHVAYNFLLQRLTSVCGVLWAISSDHQIYVFVPKRDVPIRVREELYENEVEHVSKVFTRIRTGMN